jgi:hypothetical protein
MDTESTTECTPLPIFRPDEEPSKETNCLKDQAARRLYEAAAPATARIDVSVGMGSGFFIGDGSQVVTNAHVVSGERQLITVRAHAGEIYKARIEKLDDINDLAILKLEKGARHVSVLDVVSSQCLTFGDDVYGLGHPKGRRDTYISPGHYEDRYPLVHVNDLIPDEESGGSKEGAIAAYSEDVQKDLQAYLDSERLATLLQGQSGSSGSPIVNDHRQTVGILANGAPGKTMANYSWAVPSERLQDLMEPGNKKFTFDYQDVSRFRLEPGLVTMEGGAACTVVLRLPRAGGTAMGALSLLSVPTAAQRLMYPEHDNDRLHASLSLASTAGFVSGAALAYFDRTRVLARASQAVGLAGLIGQSFVPRHTYLTDIKRTDGDTRLPFMWGV